MLILFWCCKISYIFFLSLRLRLRHSPLLQFQLILSFYDGTKRTKQKKNRKFFFFFVNFLLFLFATQFICYITISLCCLMLSFSFVTALRWLWLVDRLALALMLMLMLMLWLGFYLYFFLPFFSVDALCIFVRVNAQDFCEYNSVFVILLCIVECKFKFYVQVPCFMFQAPWIHDALWLLLLICWLIVCWQVGRHAAISSAFFFSTYLIHNHANMWTMDDGHCFGHQYTYNHKIKSKCSKLWKLWNLLLFGNVNDFSIGNLSVCSANAPDHNYFFSILNTVRTKKGYFFFVRCRLLVVVATCALFWPSVSHFAFLLLACWMTMWHEMMIQMNFCAWNIG